MTTMLEITSLSANDLDAAFTLQSKVYSAALVENEFYFKLRYQQVGEYFLAAKKQHQLIGYIVAFPWKRGDIPKNNAPLCPIPTIRDCFYLHDIGIDPAYQGQGVAQKLLSALIEQAKSKGLPRICLVAIEAAVVFWQKQNFIQIKLSPQMEKKLIESYGAGAQAMELELNHSKRIDCYRLD